MPIQRIIIHGGMRLTHPSGVKSTTTIEQLRKQKEITNTMIASLQEQIRQLDLKIQEIERGPGP